MKPIAVASILLAATLGACEARLALGAHCTLSSDCEERLVCAGGRCRAECREDRDCAGPDDTCSRFGGTAGVCTPPSTPLPCELHSDCGAAARCQDGSCRADCRIDADCDGLGTCVENACTVPITTPPSRLDAGADRDAGSGDGGGAGCGSREVRCVVTGACHDLDTDEAHCGSCGRPCTAGGTCEGGRCVCAGGAPCAPTNDECTGALRLDLARGGGVATVAVDFAGATASPNACFVSDPDLFYRFTLTERSIVALYLDAGTSDAYFLEDGCGTAPRACVDDPCELGGGHHRDIALLDPGEHFLVVGTADSTAGTLAIVSSVPIGDVPATELSSTPATFTTSVTTSASDPAAGCGAGPAHVFYWWECASSGAAFRTCGTSFPTALEGHWRMETPLCALPGACPGASELAIDYGEGGPMVLFVSGVGATDFGTIELEIERM